MSQNIDHIHKYYSPDDLYARILNGLEKLDLDLSHITIDDLQPVDEFHIRGDDATRELIALSGFTPDMHILDAGCGIGGSTRRLAHETGCHATGIDLSESYIETARRLTNLVRMEELVDFRAASALDLPYENDSFDGIWSLQMGMNIKDKLSWMRELYRVIRPGGRAILYEVCGGPNAPPHFPVPWAQDSSMSHLVEPDAFRALVQEAEFEVNIWEDKTELARKAFAHVQKPAGPPKLPALGVYMLVGEDIGTKAHNLHRNLEEERVSLIEAVATKAAPPTS